ncbi:BatD family protein [Photobacterium carnosum]|uniref:BatD family protein n=1 Tax=Photobacterium carnosum TaxID=2023717 RepID=UPI001E2D0D4C|nr:BatD family protein [Photobacterium carnosum]MCD9536228.1 protein BatD [Photobacterium carnosum]MCF2160616.1 protein BatD [Photobacterium carnosum]
MSVNKSNWIKKCRSPWLLLLTMFITLLPLQAIAAQAEATVSKNVVAVNQVFRLSISVDTAINPDSIDFSVLSPNFAYGQPNASSSTSFINGALSRNTTWTLAVAAKNVGTTTIPAFKIGSSQTTPITITVLKGSQTNNSETDQTNVRVTAEIDKNILYVGESINYRVKIFIGEQLSQASLSAPSGDGLTVSQVGQDAQHNIVQNGRRYLVITRNYQLTAEKAGKIIIQGSKFNGNAVRGANGFNSGITVPVNEDARNITINIKPKPIDYKGLWLPTPDLQLQQTWQPQVSNLNDVTTKVGEPITRTITLRIKDVAQSNMPNVNLTYPDTVRIYNEKPEYRTENGYSIMTLKQVIIPRQTGKVTLPPLTINWWNTTTEKQQRSEIKGLTLNVIADPTANNQFSSPATITPPAATIHSAKTITAAGIWPWTTLVFALLWLITLVLLIKKRQQTVIATTVTATQTTDITSMLEAAINANEPIKVQTYYQQWRQQQYSTLTTQPQLLQQLDNEVQAMMATHYSPLDSAWNNQTLLALLIQVKQLTATKKAPMTLSSLDPQ